jgi:hypothetical protein
MISIPFQKNLSHRHSSPNNDNSTLSFKRYFLSSNYNLPHTLQIFQANHEQRHTLTALSPQHKKVIATLGFLAVCAIVGSQLER